MKKQLFFLLKLLCMLLAGIIAGFCLMLAVYALPQDVIAQNVRDSVPALDGRWGREESYHQLLPGYVGTQLDNSTDASMLLAAAHEGVQPLWIQAAENCSYSYGGNSYDTLCVFDEVDPSEMQSVQVARYWHGYLVVLKPLLLFFSYTDIRMILMMAQSALMAVVAAGLYRAKLQRLLIPFLISLVCLTPSATGFSMQFSTALYTFLLGMIGFLYLPQKRLTPHGQLGLMMLIGMCTSYVDYLTYPIATFGMPFIICMMRLPLNSAKKEWKRFILCGLCWAIGYFGMWAGKWVIAGLFSYEQWFWQNLVAKITQRSSSVDQQTAISYADVLRSVLSIFVKRAYLLLAAALAIGFAISLTRSRRREPAKAACGTRSVLLSVALLPFVWFFFTKNHTYLHSFFTSRSLVISVFALCCLAGTFVRPKESKNPLQA